MSFRAQPRNLTIKRGRRNAGRNELKTPRVRLMRRQSAAIHLPSPCVGHSVPGFLHVGRTDKGEWATCLAMSFRAQPRNLTIKCGRRNAGRNELKTPRVRLMRRQSAAIHLPSPFVGHSVPGFLHVGRNDKRGELLSAISFALSCSYAPRAQVSPAPSGWRVPAAVRLRAAPAAIRLRAAEVFAPVLRPKARSALLICS